MVKGVGNARGRGACHIDMLAAVVFEGGAEVKGAEAVLGPRSTGAGVYMGDTQLARRMNGVGVEAEGYAVKAVPSRDKGRCSGGGCPGAKMVECEFGSGEEEVPKVSRVCGMDRGKVRHQVILSSLNRTFSRVGSVVVRGSVGSSYLIQAEEST